jgi:hypothetical protein
MPFLEIAIQTERTYSTIGCDSQSWHSTLHLSKVKVLYQSSKMENGEVKKIGGVFFSQNILSLRWPKRKGRILSGSGVS